MWNTCALLFYNFYESRTSRHKQSFMITERILAYSFGGLIKVYNRKSIGYHGEAKLFYKKKFPRDGQTGQ